MGRKLRIIAIAFIIRDQRKRECEQNENEENKSQRRSSRIF